ncbi:cytochrome aa3 quinol oxidase subunit I [Caldifermentibacillus hisashii]|uniref:cytochrome aa3 quinol oxidase subunit I n=1 Tax=Caldifermentibacillus hisashii TaxID=996558 RepID=UPI003D218B1D
MDIKWGKILVTGEPMILMAQIGILLTSIGVVVGLTYFKKWKWLWENWLTTVDHKKIGIMYILLALVMLFRGGVDALMMRAQTAVPENTFLNAQHYNEVFTTHGVIMILFMAMPILIGIMNIIVPLQIGARDVAFPQMNAMSFWLTVAGAILFNISFIIGGSPDAGWTSYFPLAGKEFNPGIGNNYYMISLQIAGLGTLMSGINFIVSILKMRTKGMTLFKMPMFTWTTLVTSLIIVIAFPIFTVTLLLGTLDRLYGTHFFTISGGGLDMLWNNLFWLWGHPEVYIVVLPAFGMVSEVVSTFSKKRLFGYHSMVWAILIISVLSMLVWAHHFYTMGLGPVLNSIFSITTMLIAVPTGIKMFNWLFTMHKGRIEFTNAMMWALAFIPTFLIGGVTGVMLAMAAANFQYHNTMFVVAHFHYTLVGAVVYSVFAGFYYWFPKVTGFKLNEKIGKWHFWLFNIGFNLTFFPMFFAGLDGAVRRSYTYSSDASFAPLMFLSFIGTLIIAAGVAALVWNIIYSIKNREKHAVSNDPWDARTLEWSTASPPPEYNFALLPEVEEQDQFWHDKKSSKDMALKKKDIKPIHLPSNTGMPFIMGMAFTITGFFFVFELHLLGAICAIGIFACLIYRSFDYDDGRHVSIEEITKTEGTWREVS